MAGKSLKEIVSKSSSKVLKEKMGELQVVRSGLDEETSSSCALGCC